MKYIYNTYIYICDIYIYNILIQIYIHIYTYTYTHRHSNNGQSSVHEIIPSPHHPHLTLRHAPAECYDGPPGFAQSFALETSQLLPAEPLPGLLFDAAGAAEGPGMTVTRCWTGPGETVEKTMRFKLGGLVDSRNRPQHHWKFSHFPEIQNL